MPPTLPAERLIDAYEFYRTVLDPVFAGRAQVFDPDHIDALGAGKDYRILLGYTVKFVFDEHEPKPGVFEAWFFPDPTQLRPEFSPREMEVMVAAAARVQCGLCERGLMVRCERARCRRR